jgi:L-seryl-tRNA(Ser) seleniumtransferase
MLSNSDPRPAEGLRTIINVSGTMTGLGASIVVPQAVEAVAAFLPHFVEIGDLHRKASAEIAAACGSEAGFVTACAAAGITLSIAGAMTGTDLCAIERLPDATGLKHEVPIQVGHMCHYGAPVEQSIRLAGARPVPVGTSTKSEPYQLAGAINERTAAAIYVVSHHVVDYGQIPLESFAEVCRAKGVPVIVDAASEYDLKGFLAKGADVVVYSAHKFLGGPTAGIVAGRKDLVRAAYLQNNGIGRGMKVGKESVIGTMAALRAWAARDHAAVRRREVGALMLWRERLSRVPGLVATIVPDPTENPLDRLEVRVDPAAAGCAAWDLADALAAGDPPVIVRDHEVEHGLFFLDPCNLHPGQEAVVANRIEETCRRAADGGVARTTLAERKARRLAGLLAWPD